MQGKERKEKERGKGNIECGKECVRERERERENKEK